MVLIKNFEKRKEKTIVIMVKKRRKSIIAFFFLKIDILCHMKIIPKDTYMRKLCCFFFTLTFSLSQFLFILVNLKSFFIVFFFCIFIWWTLKVHSSYYSHKVCLASLLWSHVLFFFFLKTTITTKKKLINKRWGHLPISSSFFPSLRGWIYVFLLFIIVYVHYVWLC